MCEYMLRKRGSSLTEGPSWRTSARVDTLLFAGGSGNGRSLSYPCTACDSNMSVTWGAARLRGASQPRKCAQRTTVLRASEAAMVDMMFGHGQVKHIHAARIS